MALSIETVTGALSPEQFGPVLMHEHLLCDLWEWSGRTDYNAILDDEGIIGEELALYRQAGGSAVVDVTTDDIGRNPEGLARLSTLSGVVVVMGSGWYRERVYPRIVYELSTNQLAEAIIQEFDSGVGETGIRPGIIGEIGTERFSISPAEERVFRAAARAQRVTGATITTHTTHFGDLAHEQVDLLLEEGVPPERIIVGHLGERRTVELETELARRGVFVEIDHVGRAPAGGLQPERQRAKNVADLVRAGHLDQILISMDICANSLLHWYGGHGYDYLLERFLPMLCDEGLTESQVETIVVENPRRALAF